MLAQRLTGVGSGEGVVEERLALLLKLLGHVLAHHNPVDAGRELFLQRGEALGQIEAREVHVGIAIELDPDLGGAQALLFERLGDDLLHARDLLDRRLERRGEKRFECLGRRAPPRPGNRELRELRVRKHLDGNVLPCADTQQRDRHVGHGHRHRSSQAHPDHRVTPRAWLGAGRNRTSHECGRTRPSGTPRAPLSV